MGYKVGDKVRIKSDLDSSRWLKGPEVFIGEVVTISKSFDGGFYFIEEDVGGSSWEDDEIEGLASLEEKEELTGDAIKLIEMMVNAPNHDELIAVMSDCINIKRILDENKKEYKATHEQLNKLLLTLK